MERKQREKKEGKTTCKRKNNVVCRKESLTMIGLEFVIKIVTTISLKNSINRNLGVLGYGFN